MTSDHLVEKGYYIDIGIDINSGRYGLETNMYVNHYADYYCTIIYNFQDDTYVDCEINAD